MINRDLTVRTIAGRMVQTQDELVVRQALLNFGEEDAQLLRNVDYPLSQTKKLVAEKLFHYLMAFPPLNGLLPNAETVEQLRLAHGCYISRLTVEGHNEAYLQDLVRVAAVYRHVGLDTKWYISACRNYLSAMAATLRSGLEGDAEHFSSTFDALLKVVFVDIGLTLDTCFEVDR